MLSFLLPFASKIISDAVNKIPDDAELGEEINRYLFSYYWQGSQIDKNRC